jgi:hypothetical protein
MRRFHLLLLLVVGLLSGCSVARKAPDHFPTPQIDFAPKHYVCTHADSALTIDGRLDEAAWSKADFTDAFVDIEGAKKPVPRFETQVKMLWDSSYFYVAAVLTETDVWATLTQRDAVIFHDNDFEIFIDPDGDTHEYYEFEMNALNTVWDLLLVKPYRDGGPAVDAWDIQGLKTAVNVSGTLNQPGDVDTCWTVEVATPWSVLKQCAHKAAPPREGDQWRVNFSRVEWQTEVADSAYQKISDPKTGKTLPEANWVWSPQGLVNMHYPEMWGFVQFTNAPGGDDQAAFTDNPDEWGKWTLRRVYYGEWGHFNRKGFFTGDIAQLQIKHLKLNGFLWPPKIEVISRYFQASIESKNRDRVIYITSDGRTRVENRIPAKSP